MDAIQETKQRTAMWSSRPIAEYLQRGNETSWPKRQLHSPGYCGIFHNGQEMEQPKHPSNERIKEIQYVCTITLLKHKKGYNLI